MAFVVAIVSVVPRIFPVVLVSVVAFALVVVTLVSVVVFISIIVVFAFVLVLVVLPASTLVAVFVVSLLIGLFELLVPVGRCRERRVVRRRRSPVGRREGAAVVGHRGARSEEDSEEYGRPDDRGDRGRRRRQAFHRERPADSLIVNRR